MADPSSVLTVGVLLSVLAATALAIQSLCIRYGTVTNDSTQALVVVLGVNIVVLVPSTLLLEWPFQALTVRSVLAFAAAGFLGTMAGRAIYYEGIKRIGASRADPIRASQPLHASLVAGGVIVGGGAIGVTLSG